MSETLDFGRLQGLMQAKAGYALPAGRASAVAARLGPLARRDGFSSAGALIEAIAAGDRPSLMWEVVEAVLPADTRFFRDREPFGLMCSDLLPTLAQARGGVVRVLSVGCATGQEAWSVAICAAEAGVLGVEILGLDLSRRAIEKARSGLYSAFEVQRGLRSRQLIRWLDRSEESWRIRDPLRDRVRFERANLIDGLSGLGAFDLIFCRHVLGDMTPEARRRAAASLAGALAPSGCLFLGVGEAVPEAAEAFRPVAGLKSVYVKGGSAVSRAA